MSETEDIVHYSRYYGGISGSKVTRLPEKITCDHCLLQLASNLRATALRNRRDANDNKTDVR